MKRLTAVLCSYLLATQSFGAIALDPGSWTNGGYYAGGALPGTLTWTHTYGGGANGIVIVRVCTVPTTTGVTSVTYGGVAMSQLATHVSTATSICGATGKYYYYGAYGPATGASSIVVSSVDQMVATSISYSGAAQSGQPDASNFMSGNCAGPGGGGFSNYCSATITVGTANAWVLTMFGAATTTVAGQPSPAVGGVYRGGMNFSIDWEWDSNGPASLGMYTLTGGTNAAGAFEAFSITLKPFAAPGAVPHRTTQGN